MVSERRLALFPPRFDDTNFCLHFIFFVLLFHFTLLYFALLVRE